MRTSSIAARQLAVKLFCLMLPVIAGACDSDPENECAPHAEAIVAAPDGAHVAQQWVTICGFPGATVGDIISVSDKQISGPQRRGAFVFFEEQGSTIRNQISAAWIDGHHLNISVNALGEIKSSPHKIGDITVSYSLGPSVDLQAMADHMKAKSDERQKWERLKTSSAWRYIEASYYYDIYIVKHEQTFIDWAHNNTYWTN